MNRPNFQTKTADKLAQRGQVVTDELQAEFTKMKEAYEILSDPHKRETYDAIGARGMKWIEEPFSIDPQELATNFARSSVIDRSKIFAIFSMCLKRPVAKAAPRGVCVQSISAAADGEEKTRSMASLNPLQTLGHK